MCCFVAARLAETSRSLPIRSAEKERLSLRPKAKVDSSSLKAIHVLCINPDCRTSSTVALIYRKYHGSRQRNAANYGELLVNSTYAARHSPASFLRNTLVLRLPTADRFTRLLWRSIIGRPGNRSYIRLGGLATTASNGHDQASYMAHPQRLLQPTMAVSC